jgi:hypothetical protein
VAGRDGKLVHEHALCPPIALAEWVRCVDRRHDIRRSVGERRARQAPQAIGGPYLRRDPLKRGRDQRCQQHILFADFVHCEFGRDRAVR